MDICFLSSVFFIFITQARIFWQISENDWQLSRSVNVSKVQGVQSKLGENKTKQNKIAPNPQLWSPRALTLKRAK